MIGLSALVFLLAQNRLASAKRPNILIAIADDQSFPYASAYGTQGIHTPAFDSVAKQGILFHSAFTPAPGCSPMRAAFLTGREIWQIGAAATSLETFLSLLSSLSMRVTSLG